MIVVPVGNTKLSHIRVGLPGIGQLTIGIPVRVMFTVPQLVFAEATPSSSSSRAEQEFVVTDTLGGTVSVGGELSVPVTVTVCGQDTVCVSTSDAVQVIVVTPTG